MKHVAIFWTIRRLHYVNITIIECVFISYYLKGMINCWVEYSVYVINLILPLPICRGARYWEEYTCYTMKKYDKFRTYYLSGMYVLVCEGRLEGFALVLAPMFVIYLREVPCPREQVICASHRLVWGWGKTQISLLAGLHRSFNLTFNCF